LAYASSKPGDFDISDEDAADIEMMKSQQVTRSEYEKHLAGERANFRVVNAKVKQLGQIPVLGKYKCKYSWVFNPH